MVQTRTMMSEREAERLGVVRRVLSKMLTQALGAAQLGLSVRQLRRLCAPAHERAIRTRMNWNIEVDEAMFLGGLPKGELLREFEPDFFFDDQTGHIEHAARHVPSGHVASGISNAVPGPGPHSPKS